MFSQLYPDIHAPSLLLFSIVKIIVRRYFFSFFQSFQVSSSEKL